MEWIKKMLQTCEDFILGLYGKISDFIKWPYSEYIKLWVVMLIAFVLLVVLIIVIVCSIKRNKKRKITFYVSGRLLETIKVSYKKPINYPDAPIKEGYNFIGWCLDRACKVPYDKDVLDRKKDFNLHSHYEKITSTYAPIQSGSENLDSGMVVESIKASAPVVYNSEYIYDELRYVMLGYERALQFKKLGVTRKQVIAEMFEKDGVVNLYLKLDPDFMREKGYNVETYEDPIFAIVPCKLQVKTKEDFDEALKLIKETMTVNNLVQSGITYAQKPKSTEALRKSGFAFFVKNETVATTAEDYYRLLRAIVVSYGRSETRKVPDGVNNKLILKIYKKAESLYVYLALDPVEEGLEDVSYDRSFLDTPARLEVKTAEDCMRANEFIDKLMYRYGMERNPEKAEISLTDSLDVNCGFGWRVKS